MNRAIVVQNPASATSDRSATLSNFPPHFGLEYEPDLIEAAVIHALQRHPEQRSFYRCRDPLYTIDDPEAREAGFQALHHTWFTRLRLERGIDQALRERPLITGQVSGCKVMRARSARDEGAEMFVAKPAVTHRWVVLRLRPERLAEREPLLEFLRHELLHIADMLDPTFGYQPALTPSEVGPAHDRLLRDRYRVLWDTWVDGRLKRLGWASPSVHDHRLREFARTFPMLGDHTTASFARFFDGDAVTHGELVRFAYAPEASLGHLSGVPHQGERCPLCRFPTHTFEPQPDSLAPDVLHAIGTDFPTWQPAQGICLQCAGIYRARVSP